MLGWCMLRCGWALKHWLRERTSCTRESQCVPLPQAMIRSDYGTAVTVSGGSALFDRGSDKTLLTQSHLGEERITVHIWNKPRQEPERSTDYWLMIRLLSHKAQVHLSRDDTAHMIHNQDNLPQAWSQARVIWAIPLLKLPQMIRGHVKLAAEGS